MKRLALLPVLTVALVLLGAALGCEQPTETTDLRFEISFPASVHTEPLTGRMFLAFARQDDAEPRLQVRRYGVPFFGVDFENLKPGEAVVIDGSTLGYPAESLADLPPGDYYVQAILSKYTKFERADGHTVWMRNDQWEGQNWRRSPGNLTSDVLHLTLEAGQSGTVRMETAHVLPPIERPEDTRWVKRFKIQSEILTAFWGHPIYLGATILLQPDTC